jgi:GABA permease
MSIQEQSQPAATERTEPGAPDAAGEGPELKKSLKSRHMTMISLGGVIGAGLFVGSSAVIKTTGPAAVVSYLLAGVLIVLVMRMLGEMAVANPQVGSFAEYARRSLGGWAGFSVGWLYWYFWSIVLAIEAVAGAEILQRWIDAPVWLMAVLLMALLTGINLTSVKSFGEFEFWFAGIKVVAIVAFIVIAAGFLLGIGSGHSPGLSNLTAHEGFAPAGIVTVLSGVVIVIFAFVGAEIVTIAAAESGEPEQAVTRAVNQVVARVLTFYVAAIFLIVCILPWSDAKPGNSPFIASLETIGIPGAADVMNAIVVTAVLSCLNSGMYTGSRMLFALARRGDAPKSLLEINGRGVPVKAILLTSSIGFASTGLAYISPDKVFLFLVNSSGAIALFVYVLIACSELKMRRRLEREAPERLKLRMWLFPYLTYFAIVAMVAVIASMALVKDVRAQLIPSFISLAVVLAAYWFKTRAERQTATVAAAAAGAT